MRPTALAIPDLPDTDNPPRDLEGEQEENLRKGLDRPDIWPLLPKTKEDES